MGEFKTECCIRGGDWMRAERGDEGVIEVTVRDGLGSIAPEEKTAGLDRDGQVALLRWLASYIGESALSEVADELGFEIEDAPEPDVEPVEIRAGSTFGTGAPGSFPDSSWHDYFVVSISYGAVTYAKRRLGTSTNWTCRRADCDRLTPYVHRNGRWLRAKWPE